MIDPLKAFGLAANIVQFLELGGQIIQAGYRAYSSSEGTSEESIRLERVTKDLVNVTDKLALPLTPDNDIVSDADDDLEDLALQCHELARRLLEILGQLKIKSDASYRGWRAFQIALKESVTRKKDIEAISALLNTYRQQLCTHMLAVMRCVLDV